MSGRRGDTGIMDTDRPVEEVIPHLVAIAQTLGGSSLHVWAEDGRVCWRARDPLHTYQTAGPAGLIAKAWVIRYGGNREGVERMLHSWMRGTVARVRDESYDRLVTLRRSL